MLILNAIHDIECLYISCLLIDVDRGYNLEKCAVCDLTRSMQV